MVSDCRALFNQLVDYNDRISPRLNAIFVKIIHIIADQLIIYWEIKMGKWFKYEVILTGSKEWDQLVFFKYRYLLSYRLL